MDKGEEADGVLLEWSKDAQSNSSPSANLATTIPDLAGLITKCRELLKSSATERNSKIAANTKSFEWDLDVWLRGLKPIEKVQWQETVAFLKGLARSGRVPSADEVTAASNNGDDNQGPPAMHAGIIKIHNYSFTKQKDIDLEHVARNEKIRSSYVTKVKEMGASAQLAGQFDLVRQMKETLEDASDLDSWVNDMLDE